jgi:hypothetical protein
MSGASNCPNCKLPITGTLAQITAHVETCSPATRAVLPIRDSRSINEKIWTSDILGLFRGQGWLAFHDWDSRGNKEGFPDIEATRGGVTIHAELKMPRGEPSEAQVQWLDALSLDRPDRVFLWLYPEDVRIIEVYAIGPDVGLADHTRWVNRRAKGAKL